MLGNTCTCAGQGFLKVIKVGEKTFLGYAFV